MNDALCINGIDILSSLDSPNDIATLIAALEEVGTFDFPMLSNGLFPAAHFVSQDRKYMNYRFVWVRDNIHIALCHYIIGKKNEAIQTIKTLCQYFHGHRHKFNNIINGDINYSNAINRPHVRFDGDNLQEVAQDWNQAQNDALGYFLWFYSKLVSDGELTPTAEQLETIALFPRYFHAIHYWQDEDHGHWEETAKIEASSIGVVVAALEQMKQVMHKDEDLKNAMERLSVPLSLIDKLLLKGRSSLDSILPYECNQESPKQRRLYDAALLFLIYPLNVIDSEIADQILHNVKTNLQGDIGIRRYLGDTFWSPNYKEHLSDSELTDKLDDSSKRQQLNVQQGQEAQWCLFDSIVSTIYGQRFIKTKDEQYLILQKDYVLRALNQLTSPDCAFGAYKCPEAYYLSHDTWIANDATPLLWAQANLRVALHSLFISSCGDIATAYSGIPL